MISKRNKGDFQFEKEEVFRDLQEKRKCKIEKRNEKAGFIIKGLSRFAYLKSMKVPKKSIAF